MIEEFAGRGGNRLLTDGIARHPTLHRNKDLDARRIGDLPGAHDNVVRTVAEGRSSGRKEDTCCKK
jgi:hypothetical protein